MNIWIDADARPTVIEEIPFRADDRKFYTKDKLDAWISEAEVIDAGRH